MILYRNAQIAAPVLLLALCSPVLDAAPCNQPLCILLEAQTAAALVEDPKHRGELQAQIAIEIAAAGELERARESALAISDRWARIDALAWVGAAHVRGGEAARGITILLEAAETLATLRPPVFDGAYRYHNLAADLATAFITARLPGEAERVAAMRLPTVGGRMFLAAAYSRMAAASVRVAEIEEADRLFRRALAIARGFSDETHRSVSLRHVAENQIAAERTDDALNTVFEIEPTAEGHGFLAQSAAQVKRQVLRMVTLAYARAGRFDRALALYDQLHTAGVLAGTFRSVAEIASAIGSSESVTMAERLVQRARSMDLMVEERIALLAAVAPAFAAQNPPARATTLLSKARDLLEQVEGDRKLPNGRAVARGLLHMGRLQDAFDLLQSNQNVDGPLPESLLSHLAAAATAAEDRRLLGDIEAAMGGYRGSSMDAFQRHKWHIDHGQLELALAMAREAPTAWGKAYGLLRIAQAMQCTDELAWLWPVDWTATGSAANGRRCPPPVT